MLHDELQWYANDVKDFITVVIFFILLVMLGKAVQFVFGPNDISQYEIEYDDDEENEYEL